jgi:hypothetical protein
MRVHHPLNMKNNNKLNVKKILKYLIQKIKPK